jgi:hypothetical protein
MVYNNSLFCITAQKLDKDTIWGSLFVDGALIFSVNGGFVKSAAISNGSTN